MQLFNKAPTKKGDMGHFSKISFYRVVWESVIENGKLINTIFRTFWQLVIQLFRYGGLMSIIKIIEFFAIYYKT